MKLFIKVRKRYKDGILLNWIYQIIKKTNIKLYYLVQEGIQENSLSMIIPKISPLEVIIFDDSNITEIATNTERDYSDHHMRKMLAEGCGCLGLKYKNEVVAYTWYDLNKCWTNFISFKLKKNEAYLYAARTFSAYKGNALAPYLRQKQYQYLAQLGRTKIYSITMYENIPSILFKNKINAKKLKLYAWVRLLGLFEKNITLKRYF